MPWCDTCKEHTLFPARHKCAPMWEARFDGEDSADDWRKYRARDGDEVATKAAEEYDRDTGDYPIVRGNSILVEVRKVGEIESEWFEVRGESIPQYYASPVPPPLACS